MSKRREKDQLPVLDHRAGTRRSRRSKQQQQVFGAKGYIVSCTLAGLEIETVDYHAGLLRIPWRDLERLIVESGLVPPRAKRGSRKSKQGSVN